MLLAKEAVLFCAMLSVSVQESADLAEGMAAVRESVAIDESEDAEEDEEDGEGGENAMEPAVLIDESAENLGPRLLNAARNNCAAGCFSLIARKASVNARDAHDGQTALMIASQYGYINVLRVLLDAGAHLDVRNKDEETALYKACKKSESKGLWQLKKVDPVKQQETQLAVVKMLLVAGAQTDARPYGQGTPLMCALNDKNVDIARLLVLAGANTHVIFGTGWAYGADLVNMAGRSTGEQSVIKKALAEKAFWECEHLEGARGTHLCLVIENCALLPVVLSTLIKEYEYEYGFLDERARVLKAQRQLASKA